MTSNDWLIRSVQKLQINVFRFAVRQILFAVNTNIFQRFYCLMNKAHFLILHLDDNGYSDLSVLINKRCYSMTFVIPETIKMVHTPHTNRFLIVSQQ